MSGFEAFERVTHRMIWFWLGWVAAKQDGVHEWATYALYVFAILITILSVMKELRGQREPRR
jgi:hypothetical protein